MLSEEDYAKVFKKYEAINREIDHLRETKINPGTDLDAVLTAQDTSPIQKQTSLYDLLKRPQVSYVMIAPYDGNLKNYPREIIAQVEYEIKYEGFIERQKKDIEKFRHIEKIKIPDHFDFTQVPSLSTEIREKLKKFAPMTLGQANRISGVTPAAISVLMVYLRKYHEMKKKEESSRSNND